MPVETSAKLAWLLAGARAQASLGAAARTPVVGCCQSPQTHVEGPERSVACARAQLTGLGCVVPSVFVSSQAWYLRDDPSYAEFVYVFRPITGTSRGDLGGCAEQASSSGNSTGEGFTESSSSGAATVDPETQARVLTRDGQGGPGLGWDQDSRSSGTRGHSPQGATVNVPHTKRPARARAAARAGGGQELPVPPGGDASAEGTGSSDRSQGTPSPPVESAGQGGAAVPAAAIATARLRPEERAKPDRSFGRDGISSRSHRRHATPSARASVDPVGSQNENSREGAAACRALEAATTSAAARRAQASDPGASLTATTLPALQSDATASLGSRSAAAAAARCSDSNGGNSSGSGSGPSRRSGGATSNEADGRSSRSAADGSGTSSSAAQPKRAGGHGWSRHTSELKQVSPMDAVVDEHCGTRLAEGSPGPRAEKRRRDLA